MCFRKREQELHDIRQEMNMLRDALSMPFSKLPATFRGLGNPRKLLLEDAIVMLMEHAGIKIEYVPSSRGEWVIREEPTEREKET